VTGGRIYRTHILEEGPDVVDDDLRVGPARGHSTLEMLVCRSSPWYSIALYNGMHERQRRTWQCTIAQVRYSLESMLLRCKTTIDIPFAV
jgi:hypothetical protein